MVVECRPGYAVVLDEEGNFLKVANRQYTVGQMVAEVIPMRIPASPQRRKWYYSLATVAACLVLVLGLTLPGMAAPYASVYVKINPEVRIDVDKQDRVIGLEGVNQDGVDLIEGYTYHRKDLDLVADELVDRAIDQGYLQAEGEITLRLDSADKTWVDHHAQALSGHVQEHVQERFSMTVHVRFHHNDHDEQGSEIPEQTESTGPLPTGQGQEATKHHSEKWDKENVRDGDDDRYEEDRYDDHDEDDDRDEEHEDDDDHDEEHNAEDDRHEEHDKDD